MMPARLGAQTYAVLCGIGKTFPLLASSSRCGVPRALKFYVGDPLPGTPEVAMTDLLLDPHEQPDPALVSGSKVGLLGDLNAGTVAYDMSSLTGPYQHTLRRLNCCVDEWWNADVPSPPSNCAGDCTVAGVSMDCE